MIFSRLLATAYPKCNSNRFKYNVLLLYQSWTKMAGFVIAEKMSDLLNDKLRFRFIIASGLSMNLPTPSEATLKGNIILHNISNIEFY